MWNKEDIFAVDKVVAITKLLRIVARQHGFQIAILKADAFHLFAGEMPGAPSNREATFGGAVDQMSRRAQVAAEIRIGTHGFERGRRSAVAIFADQCVGIFVFAKFLYTRREDDQLCTVGERHAGTVDRLVAEPGAVKLVRIEINDSLADRCVQRLEVYFQAQRSGAVKALNIVTDKKAAHCQPVTLRASDDGEHIDDGQMSQESIGRVIENVTHGVLRASHEPLHPINRAQVMAAVYAFSASRAHEDGLVVIRHADNFMRHDLADGEDEVEAAMRNEPVYLRRPRVV